MSDPVRLRNAGHSPIAFVDGGAERCAQPGEEFETDARTAAVLVRATRAECVQPVATASGPSPSPILIPVGARTAGGAR